MYLAIKSSLTAKAHQDFLACKDSYKIQHATDNTKPPFYDGVKFLMAVIERSTVHTNASVSLSLTKLMRLTDTMAECESNIQKFNSAVAEERRKLRANSQQDIADEVLYQSLMTAYKTAADQDFVAAIKRKGEDHDDGESITPDQLMKYALNKYNIRSARGEWCAESQQQKEVIALAAKFESLKKTNKRLADAIKDSNKGSNKGNTHGNNGSSRSDQHKRDAPAWMKKKPKDGDPTTMHIEDKQYWWFPTHQLWQQHPPEV